MQDQTVDTAARSPERSTARTRKAPIIAIDGPAGTGKSTLAHRLACAFGWRHIDSGAMYRAAALCALEQGIAWDDESALVALCRSLTFEFLTCAGQAGLRVNSRQVARAIRSQQVGNGASQVARLPGVRAVLVAKQRELGRDGGVVMDGRDIGTVVFPDADVKFYLDATAEVRGRRRWLELQERGEATTLAEVTAAVGRRDQDDRTRQTSPLRVAAGACCIETTNLSVDEVFHLMVDKIKFFGVSFRPHDARQGMGCP